jgi:tungstate transport system substrate-binding protein
MALDRRDFLVGAAATAATAATACKQAGTAGEPEPPPAAQPTRPPDDPKLVRVASVPTAVEGNVLPVLVGEFERRGPYKVQIVANPELYTDARAGKVDLAISHYGHRHAEQFVVDGLGEWPRTIFSNQLALVGPKSDPAGLHGVDDAGEAFRRINDGRKYVVNELEGLRYVTEILWHLAGKPDRSKWLRSTKKEDALVTAARENAYVLWGLTPFLAARKRGQLAMDPFCLADPLFQRLLVSIVVKPSLGGINVEGAHAFQRFLLEPETQARMRSIAYSDEDQLVTWVPAGRHNRIAVLPGTDG